MMENFNKGPWVRAGNTVIHEKSRFGICKVIGEDDVDIANAALIAAAPEMYEMLKRCSEILDYEGLYSDYLQVEQLLAKARGEA